MNHNKISLFIFMIIVFNCLTILAQQKYLDKMLKQHLGKPLYDLVNEIDTAWFNEEILEKNISKNIQMINLKASSSPDSVITTKANGSKEKYIYHFDHYNNMTMKLSQNWDGTQWVNYRRKTYDSFSNSISILYSYWDGNKWLFEWRKTFQYDSKGRKTFFFFERWDENHWEAKMRYNYTYDSNLAILLTEEIWHGQWRPVFQYSSIYDTSGNRTNLLVEMWVGSKWELYYKSTFTYDADGNMIVELLEDFYRYEDGFKQTYTYDTNGNITSILYEPTIAPYSSRLSFEYDSLGNKVIKKIWESREHSEDPWENDYREKYSYDENGNMYLKIKESWSWSSDKWRNNKRWSYNYDSHGNLNVGLYEEWGNGHWNTTEYNGTLKFYDSYGREYGFSAVKINAFYGPITNIKDEILNITTFSLSQNYPNPFNPTTTITYSIPKSGFVKLTLYDIQGVEIKKIVNKEQQSGNYKIELNASYLPSGIYFYNLQSGGFSETKKLVLLK